MRPPYSFKTPVCLMSANIGQVAIESGDGTVTIQTLTSNYVSSYWSFFVSYPLMHVDSSNFYEDVYPFLIN